MDNTNDNKLEMFQLLYINILDILYMKLLINSF